MKEALTYPFKKIINNWLGLIIMIIPGIYMAIKGMPGFLIGIAIGLVLCYIALFVYKLVK